MMNELPRDDREAKLPQWARSYIEGLRRTAYDAARLAESAALATNPAESAAILDPYSDTPIGLGSNPQVVYRVPFPGYAADRGFIEIRQLGDRPGLYVHGTGEIITRNRAINAIEVVPWPK